MHQINASLAAGGTKRASVPAQGRPRTGPAPPLLLSPCPQVMLLRAADQNSSHLYWADWRERLEEVPSSFPAADKQTGFPGSAEGLGGCQAASALTCEQSAFLWIFL